MNDNNEHIIDLKICRNCKLYDSFQSVCLHYGVIRYPLESCSHFVPDTYKEMVDGLKNKIKELESRIDSMSKL